MADKYKSTINSERALLDFSVPADYRNVSEFIDIMANRYPFLSVTSIGESVLGKRIHMLSLGNAHAEAICPVFFSFLLQDNRTVKHV